MVSATKIRNVAKRAAQQVAPVWTKKAARRIRLGHQARVLSRSCPQGEAIHSTVDRVLESSIFRPTQKRSEISALLRLLKDRRPERICEIGGYQGGTLFLFCRAASQTAHLLSIDLEYTQERSAAYRRFACGQQTICCFSADSHLETTRERVAQWLGGERLDFLFIDGDHSYNGVRSDFLMYSPLVKTGGVIAFHDIHPDYRTRYGRATASDVGKVPAFWSSVKRTYTTDELVEDEGQDGYGIGILHVE